MERGYDHSLYQAKRLLAARKSHTSESLCPCLPFLHLEEEEYTYQQVNVALSEMVDTDGPVGVVKALLTFGADVNYDRRPARSPGFWGRITHQQEAGLRSDLLFRAVLRCQPETVRAIASLADHENLEGALRQAIARKDLHIVEALLDQDGPARSSPGSLDKALGVAYVTINDKDTQRAEDIIMKCLAGGSYGPETDRFVTEGLVRAVQFRKVQLVDAVVGYSRPSQETLTEAMLVSIRSFQLNMLLKLLRLHPAATTLTTCVNEAIRITDFPLRYEVIRMMVGGGAQESCTAAALIHIVAEIIEDEQTSWSQSQSQLNRRLFRFLLEDGIADVDYNDGEALKLAVQAEEFDLVDHIVAHQPSANTLGAALPHAMAMPTDEDPRRRREMVSRLLRFPINEEAAGAALVQAVREGTENKALIKLLMTRASVNYRHGECFVYVIRHNKIDDLLRLLLDQGTSYKALFTAVREALQAPLELRRRAFGIILNGHLQVDHLNEALKHLILEEETDLTLVGVLLEHGADPAFDNGVCIKNAAYRLDRDALSLLAQFFGGGRGKEGIFSRALEMVLDRGRDWIAFEHVDMVRILLRWGGAGAGAATVGGSSSSSAVVLLLSRAMTEVVDELTGREGESSADLAKTLLDILLRAGADIEFDGGRAVEIATTRRDRAIFAQLKAYQKLPEPPQPTGLKEVKTRRGQVIGTVDVTELRKWQGFEAE